MKKPNQAPEKNGRTAQKSAQQKQPRWAEAAPARNYTDAGLMRLARTVSKKPQKAPPRVITGAISWTPSEYETARQDGRFVTTDLTPHQDVQSRDASGCISFENFLLVATDEQLEMLRGTVALYWTQFHFEDGNDQCGPAQLMSLRGNAPKGQKIPVRNRSREHLRWELRRRAEGGHAASESVVG